MKTLDEVIKDMEQCKYLDSDCSQCPALHYLKEYKTLQYGYIKAMADLEDNPPLTWKELKGMEGKPVWIEGPLLKEGPHWIILGAVHLYEGKIVGYGKTWQAYRKERE